MKKFFNWVFVLAGCVGVFYFIGLIVPRSMTSGSKTNLNATPAQVYAAIADVESWPQWHPDVRAVSPLDDSTSGNDRWRVTEKAGQTFDLEVGVAEEGTAWQATYTIEGSRYTLRVGLYGHGEGARVQVVRTVDTRDTWERARAFLWSRKETDPIGVLNALARHLGEDASAQKD